LLPLNADDSIDFDRLESQVAVLASSEVDGLYAHGTAGEFQTLTGDEFDRINPVLAAAGKPFQLGASHPSAQVQLSRVERAAKLAPGAIQVIVPDWLPLNAREMLAFLQRVADVAGEVPLVLYNPPHAKTAVAPRHPGSLADAVGDGGAGRGGQARRPATPARTVPGFLVASFQPHTALGRDPCHRAPKGQFLPGTSQAHGPSATGDSGAPVADLSTAGDRGGGDRKHCQQRSL
jgi:hypothetical protein